jgi:CelD/BcsL family acetyltransferase involved in cellulose biosynthesis
MPWKLDEIDSLQQLTRMEGEWSELWDRCPAATPFQSPDWLLPWFQRLWGGGRLWVIALRLDGRLAGLAPLVLCGDPGQPVRVSLGGAGISDYLDILIEPEHERRGAEMVFEQLAGNRDQWQICDFQELREVSPLLHAAVPDVLRCQESPCGVCPVLQLPPSFEELLSGLPAGFRKNLRYSEKLLSRAGAVQYTSAAEPGVLSRIPLADARGSEPLVVPSDPEGAVVNSYTGNNTSCEALLTALCRLHSARWNTRGDTGVLSTSQLQRFYGEVARRFLARHLLRLHALELDGACIAVQYNFCARGRTYFYLSGFDPDHARFSPGTILLAHSIAEAIREGCEEFDFLRKSENYKCQWGARDRINRRLLVFDSASQAYQGAA